MPAIQTSASGAYMKKLGFFRDLHRHASKTRKLGTIALELAYVAAGRFDLLIAGKERPQAWWDLAGGVVVDLEGRPLTPESSHVVAGPRHLVDAFLRWFAEY